MAKKMKKKNRKKTVTKTQKIRDITERKKTDEKIEVKQVSEREIWVGKCRQYLGEDNILYVTAIGGPDDKTATEIKAVCIKLINMGKGKVSSIIDLTKAGKPSSEARKRFIEIIEYEKLSKCAFYGLHPVAKVLAAFVMGVSKKKDLRFFKTKEGALKWLKE